MTDKYSKHEALDRAQLLAEVFEGQLAQHPFIKADPSLSSRCDAIADYLGALYQAIGQSNEEG